MNRDIWLFAVLFAVGLVLALWTSFDDRNADGGDRLGEDAAEPPAMDRDQPAGRGTARPDFYFEEK